ncbi:MAG: hypothetical protein K2X48_04460 [Chitinophagaceae bacterium]|nr:hypothetical protein [Chitinophagaceae bacterium]
MKTITGSPARKEQFFKRPLIRAKILKAVASNENLLISAPRRVGKSSILLDLVDAPDENYYAVFSDTEAITSSEDFFKVILHAILDADKIEAFGFFNHSIKEKLKKWTGRIAGISIGPVGLDITKQEKKTYFEELNEFLTDIKLEGKKILMLIDEFPITIEKIQEAHGLEAAVHFLSQNRSLRQNPVFQEKIQFVYTGSIGLFTAVKRIQATDKINDLREIKINALSKEEATLLITLLLKEECNQTPSEEIINYILAKLEWWIPFYFQLMVRELADLQTNGHVITTKTVDAAFEKIIENGNIYFEHFKDRLQKVFKSPQLGKFVDEFLLAVKNNSDTDYAKALNMAEKYDARAELDTVIEVLKHDGYIVEENNFYKFYSPILKRWWK